MPRFPTHCTLAAIFLAMIPVGATFAHGDSDPLFVAEGGEDAGNCKVESAPCASIGYALQFAGKGGQIRVAEGTYAIENPEDVFHLVSGVLDVTGGFRVEGDFRISSSGVSVLTGVPYEYREILMERGFQVIADQKGVDGAKARQMLQVHQQLKSSIAATPCQGGMAGSLPCNNVDLLSHVGFNDMNVTASAGTDVWGFVDLNTGREYAIAGFNIGTAIYDVTDAENPREVGFINGQNAGWRDIKVYQFFNIADDRWNAYAYITTDGSTDGMFVIDMTGLPHSVSKVNYASDISRAHNVYATNTDYATGLALNNDPPELIVAGSNIGGGRYRTYSLANPASPVAVAGGNGSAYMHDASSMTVSDGRMAQCPNATSYCQVLMDFRENSIDLWDVTDSANPAILSNTQYLPTNNDGYVHSGWWSEDKQFMFVHDETDEINQGLMTTVRVFDVSNLTSPSLAETWSGPTTAIDHNGFVRGNRYYMSNYSRGLTVLDITDPTNIPASVGRLDTYPFSDARNFVGAWGTYPFFFSGNIAISDIDSGFYMAQDNTRNVNEGSFSFAAPSFAVEEGPPHVQMSVQRNGGQTGAVSVNYEILAATAQSADYQVTSGVLNWGAGDATDKTIDVTATNDGVGEGMEHLIVRLISPGGGATLANLSTASLYVSDPGAASTISFAEPIIEMTERGYATLIAIVNRRGSALGAVSVDYAMTAGDATAGVDFQGSTSGTLSWAAGDGNPKILEFSINDDGVVEPDEFFDLTMSNQVGAAISGSPTLTATIHDANGANLAPTANPGPNQVRPEGSLVTLDGGQSSDPNGDVLSFQWVQTGGPNVTLTNADASVMTYIAPNVASDTLMRFDLTVSDPAGLSNTAIATVTITRASAPPSTSSGGGALGGLFMTVLGLFALRRRFNRMGVVG